MAARPARPIDAGPDRADTHVAGAWGRAAVADRRDRHQHAINGKFTFHLFAALAEFERALIREHTRAGLAAARARARAEDLRLRREINAVIEIATRLTWWVAMSARLWKYMMIRRPKSSTWTSGGGRYAAS